MGLLNTGLLNTASPNTALFKIGLLTNMLLNIA